MPCGGADSGDPPPDNASDSPADRQASRHERMAQVVANLREMELLNYKGNKEPTLTDARSQGGYGIESISLKTSVQLSSK